MATEAQIDANRRNAQRSSGPKTSEGKERARMNALKHGLRSDQLVLPGEDPSALAAYHAAWVDDWEPTDQASLLLIDRAVAAAWKLKRTDRVETARIGLRIQAALGDWARKRDLAIDNAVNRIQYDPYAATDALEATREGQARLAELWDELALVLDHPAAWSDPIAHHGRMLELRGYRSQFPVEKLIDEGDRSRAELSLDLIATNNAPFRAKHGLKPLPPDEAAEVAAHLAGLARENADYHRDQARAMPDEAASRLRQAEAIACQIGPEDVALHRLQARLEREARSAIAGLTRLRADKARAEARAKADPRPEPSPEPEPADDPAVTNEANPEMPPAPASPAVTIEPNRVVGVDPVAQADRDRGGRTWPVSIPPHPAADPPPG